uniref:Uncharacterized protein n=1 Tax=Panagrolaimus davidi TaxID=227884 RepID=A0A914PP31_9BILA
MANDVERSQRSSYGEISTRGRFYNLASTSSEQRRGGFSSSSAAPRSATLDPSDRLTFSRADRNPYTPAERRGRYKCALGPNAADGMQKNECATPLTEVKKLELLGDRFVATMDDNTFPIIASASFEDFLSTARADDCLTVGSTSLSATIILRATCDPVLSLHEETVQYVFEEEARVPDLVKFAADNYALGNIYMFQLKWKTLDINGMPTIATLLHSPLVTHGEMYYMFINTQDDLELELNPSQMVLQTPMALTLPMTPVSSSTMTTITHERAGRSAGSAAAEVEDASAPDPRVTPPEAFRLPVFYVSTTLKRYAPAIAALAHDHKLSSQEEQEDAPSDLLKTCGLLLKLIAKYFKKKDIVSIDRLVAASHGLPSVDEMIEKRRDMKQIAPMIFIIESTYGNDYFVSTDDFALKVNGNFGDALQCLTALHYVCYIEYAKELLHFNELLENLCGINLEKMPKGRRTLKMDLDNKMPATSLDSQ